MFFSSADLGLSGFAFPLKSLSTFGLSARVFFGYTCRASAPCPNGLPSAFAYGSVNPKGTAAALEKVLPSLDTESLSSTNQ